MGQNYDWNNGTRCNLTDGDSATNTNFDEDQIYGLFFYNANNNNKSATMTVEWTDTGGNPKSRKVSVPGATADSGRASVALIWGGDIQRTNGRASAVTATLSAANGATVDAFLGSLTQPIDKSGLEQDTELQDGTEYKINKFSRFYRMLAAQNYSLTLSTTKNAQFIVVEFDPDGATVLVVRQRGKLDDFVVPLTDGAERRHNIKHTTDKSLDWSPIRGNNQQIVVLNADSVLNLGDAHIKLDPVETRAYSGTSDDRQLQGQGSR
jgi:hypothetical protein